MRAVWDVPKRSQICRVSFFFTTTQAPAQGRALGRGTAMGGARGAHPAPRALRTVKPGKTRTLGGWATWSLLWTSPLLILALCHAKARRYVVRACLSVVLPVLSWARALLLRQDSDPNARVVEDPDLPVWLAGVSSLVEAECRAKKALWEWWLDALRFSPDSAGRAHIRQVLAHPETEKKLERLFKALDTRNCGALDAEALTRFSAGIKGTVRVLLSRDGAAASDLRKRNPGDDSVKKTTTRDDQVPSNSQNNSHSGCISLEPATEREHAFLVDNFALLFPEHHPLDLNAFTSMAKLVLVRRIVKALVKRHGLHTVRVGMRSPIVVDLAVTNENGVTLFAMHTVAPPTAPGVDGHRLGAIVESPMKRRHDDA